MKSCCPVSIKYKISHPGWPSEVRPAADGVRAVCYWYKFPARLCPSPSGFLTSSLPGAWRVLRLSLSACKQCPNEQHHAECSFICKCGNAHVIHSLGPCPFCGEHLLWTCKQESLSLLVQMKKPEVPCRHCVCVLGCAVETSGKPLQVGLSIGALFLWMWALLRPPGYFS